MINPKPEKLPKFTGTENTGNALYRVAITPFHHELRHELLQYGEFYFSATQFMDAIGLAFEDQDKKVAIEYVLAFQKWLNAIKMQWFHLGYVLLPDKRIALTYSVQSTRYRNAPLVVREIIARRNDADMIAIVELTGDVSGAPSELDIRIYEAVNSTASTWISAYKRRPETQILKVSNGM